MEVKKKDTQVSILGGTEVLVSKFHQATNVCSYLSDTEPQSIECIQCERQEFDSWKWHTESQQTRDSYVDAEIIKT